MRFSVTPRPPSREPQAPSLQRGAKAARRSAVPLVGAPLVRALVEAGAPAPTEWPAQWETLGPTEWPARWATLGPTEWPARWARPGPTEWPARWARLAPTEWPARWGWAAAARPRTASTRSS